MLQCDDMQLHGLPGALAALCGAYSAICHRGAILMLQCGNITVMLLVTDRGLRKCGQAIGAKKTRRSGSMKWRPDQPSLLLVLPRAEKANRPIPMPSIAYVAGSGMGAATTFSVPEYDPPVALLSVLPVTVKP